MRRRLVKLGYHDSLKDLPVWKAEAFCIIDREIDGLNQKEAKAKRGRK